MKRILSVLLALAVTISLGVLAVSAEGGNLLQNGDFNAGTLSGWWMRSDWNGGTWEYSAGEGYEGGGCLIATGVGEGGSAYNAGLFYTLQEGSESTFVPMEGEQYQLSFMVNFLDGTSNNVYMDVNEGALGSGSANHTGGWEKVSFTFTAPSAEPLKIRCVVNGLPEGKRVAVDEICLVSLSGNHQPEGADASQSGVDKETAQLGDNLLDNGEFNKAAIPKWWCRTDWNGGYFTWVDSGGVDDTGCLKAIGDGEGTSASNAGVFYSGTEGVENYLQLETGKTYQVDASFYRPADVEGALYIDVNEGQCGVGMCSTHDEWETVSFRFLAPEDPVKIRIVANALQPEQNVYVDNVMLREVGATPTAQEQDDESAVAESIPTIQPANTAPLDGQGTASNAGLGVWLYIIVGAVVVIAVLVAALVIRGRKKNPPASGNAGNKEE